MKKMLPESELARDERFVRTNIVDRIFDPRGPKVAQRNTGPAKMGVDRPAAGERSRSLMHGIFVGEIQALEGAGRTCYDFDDETAPFQLKLDMARQCWDESRHCEISIKLGDHMGTEIGEYTESTFLFAAACNPDPVFRLCGVNRALEGLAIDVFSSMKAFGTESGDPILEFCEDWMLADEVTHVKMGSDWLRRLTETDPDRRDRTLEFQRTVDAIFNLGGFRGEDDENPIQLARDFRRLAGFTDDENDSLAALARESTSQAREMAEAATAALDASAQAPDPAIVSAITVTPDPFTLVPYDAAEIRGLLEEAVALAGIPPTADVALTVDEELFAPLTGHMSDVADGQVVLWISGANFEDNKRPCHFSVDQARLDLVVMALRANDRLSGDFADVPPDAELAAVSRAAWEAYAVGRAGRLGLDVRRPRQLYDFRLQHGFTDVADAAFDRCWHAEHITWEGVREIAKETGATDRGPSKVPVDLLRQK